VVVVGGVGRVAVFLFLEDVRPLLVELDLTGLRGKKPRTRRGVVEHGAAQAAVADDCVGVHPDQSGRRPHAAPLGEVMEERDGFALGQFRAEQGRSFPLGEPVAAGAAVEQTTLLVWLM
jgi:hypothetical protein